MKNLTGKLTVFFLLLCSLAINAMEQMDTSPYLEAPAELAQRLVNAKDNRDKTLPSDLFSTVSGILTEVKPAEIAACLKELRSVENELFDAAATYFVEQAIQCKQDKATFDKWFKEENDEEVLKILKQKFDHQKKYQLAAIFKQNPDLSIPAENLRSITSPDCLSNSMREILYSMNGNDANYVINLSGHEKGITCSGITSDGCIVTGSLDGTAKVWDKSGICITTLKGHKSGVKCIGITLDDDIVTGSDDGTAKVWDKSGTSIATLDGHAGGIMCIGITLDGRIVTGSRDKTAKVWDKSGTCITTLEGHKNWVKCIGITLDGCIVTGSLDGTAKVWDKSGACIATLDGHEDGVINCIGITSDGCIVTGSRTAKVWDKSGTCITTLKGHKSGISCISITPDGGIVTGSCDKTAKVWDRSGACIATLKGHENVIRCINITRDGYIVTGSRYIAKVWDRSGYCIATLEHGDWVSCINITPDGSIATGSEDYTAKIWDVKKWLKDITQEINNLNLEQLMLLNYLDWLIKNRVSLDQFIKNGFKTALESTKKAVNTLPPLIRKKIEKHIALPSQAFAPASATL